MGQGSELQALKIITEKHSTIENWECAEKQNPSITLKGIFHLPEQISASAQNNGVQAAATTATRLRGSRTTSWRVDLAAPQPEPWSDAHQYSLSLESHSGFIHDDVDWKGTKRHILPTTGARSASRRPAGLAGQQSLLSCRGQAPGSENGLTEKQSHSWALCWRML